MAILHIIAHSLDTHGLRKLVERSDAADAYVFIDDGVYVLLGSGLLALKGSSGKATRAIFVMADHAEERGLPLHVLPLVNPCDVTLINMADLVRLTTTYASSISW